ncbi:hypothetical protein [Methylotenera sp. G11]|uniref:hypothetical protein n=1 Tax=Methylotenera sp. G11 TaxID=1506585 RepID=UPI000647DD8D|nr:hypothetical protein [Methylotenera sp. G11]
MSESLQVAFIALAGVALGGILTGWFQRANTKSLIAAELTKLQFQIKGEARTRLLGRKQDLLMDALADLIASTDPELHAEFDYSKVVTLIHRVQLLLNPTNQADSALNNATTKLGLAIQAAASGKRNVSVLLGAQSHVVETGRAVLNQAP